MARPRKSERTEPIADVLLRAAAEVFGAVGFEAARLEDIARAAGITRASLLYHFGSKEELYAAVLARAFAAMHRVLDDALDGAGTLDDLLARVVGALTAFERENLPLLSVVLRGCLREEDATARAALEASLAPAVDRIERAVRASKKLGRFPVRAAILQLIFAHLVRSAMGSLGQALWQGEAESLRLAQRLFGLDVTSKESS